MQNKKKYRRVITYGTFDMFHNGHYNIIKRAKEYGDYLIVGVTSESFDIERGKLGVRDSLDVRIQNVRETGFADEIIVEEFQGQKIRDVQQYNVDAIVIGSDWTGKFDYLKPYCDVIYLERTRNISSTELRLKDQIVNFGLIIDSVTDSSFSDEAKYVSGIHVKCVFCSDKQIAEELCLQKEIHEAYSELSPFFENVDAVYVDVDSTKQYNYINQALVAGKHVICRSMAWSSNEQIEMLIKTARNRKLLLLDAMKIAYLRAFNQLTWMIECGEIGKVISMKCSISNDGDPSLDYTEAMLYAVYAFNCICDQKIINSSVFYRQYNAQKKYRGISIETPNGVAFLEIGSRIPLDCGLTIHGTVGKINVPNDWWNTGYFELYYFESQIKKRYCYNYEGNGIRYILREMLIMLRENSKEPLRFTYEEAKRLYKTYHEIIRGNEDEHTRIKL